MVERPHTLALHIFLPLSSPLVSWTRAERPREGVCLAQDPTAGLAAWSPDSIWVQWTFPDPRQRGVCGSQSVFSGPAATASRRTLVGMRVSRPLRPTESQPLRMRSWGQHLSELFRCFSGSVREARRTPEDTTQFSVLLTRGSQRPRDRAWAGSMRFSPGGSPHSPACSGKILGEPRSVVFREKSTCVNTGGRTPES